MSKNPGTVGFTQPKNPQGGNTTAKNKAKVGFDQPGGPTGKNVSGKKSPGNLPFVQKSAAMKKPSTKKNAGVVGFEQPKHGGSAAMPQASSKQGIVQAKATKMKGQPQVGPKAGKFSSISSLMSYRKKKYGV